MTTYKANADGPTADDSRADLNLLMVRIWDLGPKAPTIPIKPDLPTAKEGTPQYDLAMIDFRGELSQYDTGLKAYAQEKKDFDEWHRVYAGPYQIEMYSVNAREAIQIEPDRYVAELPKGRKPGKWHADQLQARAEAKRTFAQTIARDPIFGTQGASP